MSQKVLGAQLFSVRQCCQTADDLKETLAKLAKAGYSAVQVSGIKNVSREDIAKAAADNGLDIAATHMSWQQFLEDIDTVIETHKLWNCTHSAVGSLPPGYYTPDGLKRFLDELGPVAEKLVAAGLDFSYHNHHFEFFHFDGKTWLEHLYEQADPKHLKAEIDTHWVQAGGGCPAAWIRKLGDRQPLLHLKDYVIVERERRFAEIGEGNLNWPDILAAAKEAGVRWYLVEQDDCYGGDPVEALGISYRNLKAMGLE